MWILPISLMLALATSSAATAACASDEDGDLVCDNNDACPGTVPGSPVAQNGCPPFIPGDGDVDGDVDLADYEALIGCMGGPAIGPICVGLDFDFDVDGDVDLLDAAIFSACFSGVDQPGDPDCLPHDARIVDGCLVVTGTSIGSELALRLRSGAPAILEVDVRNDGTADFSFNRTAFTCILIDAGGGDDTVTIDEVNGVFTNTEMTTIRGGHGHDLLIGGSGPETFIGGDDSDTVNMGAGSDTFIWNPGDDSDTIDGVTALGDGDVDTVIVNGANGDEQFAVLANGLNVRFERLSPAPFFLNLANCEELVLYANGGDDEFSATGNLAALISITVDGGPGDDTLFGSNGQDVLFGGLDNDLIDGQQGNDLVDLGPGDDVFRWDPGDGSDIIEGAAGLDEIQFNGSSGSEIFDFAPNAGRVRASRNIGNIILDVDDVERFAVRALSGADVVTVNDLAGTDLEEIHVDLLGFGGSGDAVLDQVVINGTAGEDTITLTDGPSGIEISGIFALVTVTNAELITDRIVVNAFGGDDTVDATGVPLALTLNGDDGDDTLTGGAGQDAVSGGNDNDTIIGGPGVDFVSMGPGSDHFIWNPGDGTDTIEGDGEQDTVEVFGSDGTEQFTVTANGTRVRFDRLTPDPFSLDINACETLVLNANGGHDSLSCTGNLAALIKVIADGGPGEDTLRGSNGIDLLLGGEGNDFIDGQQGSDVIFGGAGFDVIQWDPGDGSDTIEGQGDFDRLVFNGSNGAEIYELTANGTRLMFTRNIGNVVMDVGGVEQVDLHAFGGIDQVIVNNLAGTDMVRTNIDLAIAGGGGDVTADSIIVQGTSGPDTISVISSIGVIEVLGLPTVTRILNSEAALDVLTVNGQAGADTINQGPGVGNLIQVIANP